MKKKLVLLRQDGVMPNGKAKYKRTTFANIIVETTNAELKKIADAIDEISKRKYTTASVITEEELA